MIKFTSAEPTKPREAPAQASGKAPELAPEPAPVDDARKATASKRKKRGAA